jgi:hypothetical protein
MGDRAIIFINCVGLLLLTVCFGIAEYLHRNRNAEALARRKETQIVMRVVAKPKTSEEKLDSAKADASAANKAGEAPPE